MVDDLHRDPPGGRFVEGAGDGAVYGDQGVFVDLRLQRGLQDAVGSLDISG